MSSCASDAGSGLERVVLAADGPEKVGCSFPRKLRVVKPSVFREAFDRGRRFAGQFMIVWIYRGEGAAVRLGVVASRKSFPLAVERSRAKRLIREAFRLNRNMIEDGSYDLIVVARRAILKVKRMAVDAELLAVARRAGVLKRRT